MMCAPFNILSMSLVNQNIKTELLGRQFDVADLSGLICEWTSYVVVTKFTLTEHAFLVPRRGKRCACVLSSFISLPCNST